MANKGKGIRNIDDSKLFQIRCLAQGLTKEEQQGKGIDVETVYYSKDVDTNGNIKSDAMKYFVFEYLKCQSELVTPWTSNPNRYKPNWRKFYTLYVLTTKIGGQLVLVNYSDGQYQNGDAVPEEYKNQVKVMYVSHIDKTVLDRLSVMSNEELKTNKEQYIFFSEVKEMTFEEYAKWLIQMNSNCDLPPWVSGK